MWILTEISKNPTGNFLIGAPSHKILQQSTMEKFWELVVEKDWGVFNKQEQIFYLNTGGKIFVRSLDAPDSIEGMTVYAAWLDEAGNMKERAWINVLARVAAKRGRVLCTSTPYNLGWMYKSVFKPIKEGKPGFTDFELVESRSIDNPHFPKEEFQSAKLLLSTAEFERRYMGQFRRMTGLVYEDIFDFNGDFNENVIFSQKPEEFLYVIGGIDWGYRDPTAIVSIGVTRNGHLYITKEIFRSGMTVRETADVAGAVRFSESVSAFYGGAEQPSAIQELNTRGVPVLPSNRDIPFGTSLVRSFIRLGRVHIHESCTNIQEEFKVYHYDENMRDIEIPADESNHTMDAIRYAIATHPSIGSIIKEEEQKAESDPETRALWQGVKSDLEVAQRSNFGKDVDNEQYTDMDMEQVI